MRRAKHTGRSQPRQRSRPAIGRVAAHRRKLAILWCVLSAASSLCAEQPKPSEYQVEAVYLLNFAKFVEWPTKAAPPENTFNICVLGQYPFSAALDKTIAGETIDGRKVVVQRISKAQEAMSCRILFISLSEENRLSEILKTLDKASILTVSNVPTFSQRGGMIQFVVEANKVRFEVNLASTERAGLTLSSELLKVATSVTRGPQPGD
jgi:YfiR/HmsC-like